MVEFPEQILVFPLTEGESGVALTLIICVSVLVQPFTVTSRVTAILGLVAGHTTPDCVLPKRTVLPEALGNVHLYSGFPATNEAAKKLASPVHVLVGAVEIFALGAALTVTGTIRVPEKQPLELSHLT